MEKPNIDKWLEILKMLAAPVVLALPNGSNVMPFLPLIVQEIGNVQATLKPGADKKQIVLAHTQMGIQIANQLAQQKTGKQILDPTLVLTTASAAVDAIVDATNSVHRVVEPLAGGTDTANTPNTPNDPEALPRI